MNDSNIACIINIKMKNDRYNWRLFLVNSIGNKNMDIERIKPSKPNSIVDSKNALWQWNLFLL